MIRYRVGRRTTIPNLFILSGGTIDFAAGDVTLTHSSGLLTATKRWTQTIGTLAADTVGYTLTATQPASPTAEQNAVAWTITGAGAAAQINQAMLLTYAAGYTGAQSARGLSVTNTVAGTQTRPLLQDGLGNIGIRSYVSSSGTANVGLEGVADMASTAIGVHGKASAGAAGTTYGVIGVADGSTGKTIYAGYFRTENNLTPTAASAALAADISNSSLDIFQAIDNGTVMVRIADGGILQPGSNGLVALGAAAVGWKGIYLDYTNTATIGAVTINKPSGRANIAAAASSVVVTNSLVTAASRVLAVLAANDATATGIKSVIPAAGSFTITVNAAATGNTAVDWVVINAD